jgi:hypothetical protein
MTTSGGDEDLPDPEIEIIRNLHDGVLFALSGGGVRDNSVEVPVLSRVLDHFDRLVRVVQSHRAGFEVKRRGRIVEVKGARRLLATAPVRGSFELPMRFAEPEGELVANEGDELNVVVELLASDAESALENLRDLPERVGDEMVGLLAAVDSADVDLDVVAFRNNEITARADIRSADAASRSQFLADPTWSEPGVDILRGTLFRIDTKHGRIAVDVSSETDESTVVAEASFNMDLLEPLRAALHKYVEIDVSVVEERRRYERTARSRAMTVVRVVESQPVVREMDDDSADDEPS